MYQASIYLVHPLKNPGSVENSLEDEWLASKMELFVHVKLVGGFN